MESMKRCVECGASGLRRGSEPAEGKVGPRKFLGEVETLVCRRCGETFTDGAGGVALELAAARWLAQHGFATGDEIRFMRKTAGLRAADLAELLGVSAEAVSHWETGKHRADRGTLATIAALALDRIDGRTTTQERLCAFGKPPRAPKAVKLGAQRAAPIA